MKKLRDLLLIAIMVIISPELINSQISEIQYYTWPYQCSFKADSGKFVINTKEELKQISKCILVNYDFSKYTIIGVNGGIGGCGQPTVDIKITRDDYGKKYLIDAKVLNYGSCKRNNYYKRIIYTEKLRSDYKVVFLKEEKVTSTK